MPPSRVYIRLGSHAEKDYLLKTAKLFRGVILNANLVEATPGASVSLAWKYMGNLKREFSIDPMTYVFALDRQFISSETIDRSSATKGIKKSGIKKSFACLAKQIGGVLEEVVLNQGRSLSPVDLASPGAVDDLCVRVLAYQQDRMRLFCEADPQLNEIADICKTPSFYFAPYFYIPDRTSPWGPVNKALMTSFGRLGAAVPKFGALVIARQLLSDRDWLLRFGQDIVSSACDGCWIWISNFREETATEVEVKNLVLLSRTFQNGGKQLFNMHGGYFSVLLEKFGMTGMSHGIGYGESKDVLPVSGGAVPTVNYHYPPLHVRVPILEVEGALSALGIFSAADFHLRVCDCSICVGVLNGDLSNLGQFGELIRKVGNKLKSQTPDSAKKCRFHFLLARKKEVDSVSLKTLAQVREELAETRAEYATLPSYIALSRRAITLETWSRAI